MARARPTTAATAIVLEPPGSVVRWANSGVAPCAAATRWSPRASLTVVPRRPEPSADWTVLAGRANEVLARGHGVHRRHVGWASRFEPVPSQERGSAVVLVLAIVLPIELPAPCRETAEVIAGRPDGAPVRPVFAEETVLLVWEVRAGAGAGSSRRGASALNSGGEPNRPSRADAELVSALPAARRCVPLLAACARHGRPVGVIWSCWVKPRLRGGRFDDELVARAAELGH
jgi:hypothetical protein